MSHLAAIWKLLRITDSWIETSTCWPRPERRRCASASSAPTAASLPAAKWDCALSPMCAGGPSGSPQIDISPLIAHVTMSGPR